MSAVLRDAHERPSAVLCIDLDRTPLEQAAAVLSAFGAPTVQRPEPLFEQDWAERIQHIVGSHVRETGRPVERMTRGTAWPSSACWTRPGCSPCAVPRRSSPGPCGCPGPPSTACWPNSEPQHKGLTAMTRLPDFRLETYFSRWEFTARHHLTASDVQTMTLGELLALADDRTGKPSRTCPWAIPRRSATGPCAK